MKSVFPEYFPLTAQQFEVMWKDSIVVFDTNVLLRLYRYKDSTVSEILAILDGLGSRLWIPCQVAWEYNRRRITKIKEAEKSYRDLIDDFESATKAATNRLQELKDFGVHPSVDLEKGIVALIAEVDEKISKIKSDYDGNPTAEHYARIHDRLGDLFEGRTGTCPNEADLKALLEEGEKRFDAKRAPGLRDVSEKRKRNASDREVFGDFLIWQACMDHAKLVGKPLMLVTEDAKDDWWLKEDGKTIGPLPELRKEFIGNTGSQVQFYRIQSFLEHARTQLKAEISADSEKDVQENAPAIPAVEQWVTPVVAIEPKPATRRIDPKIGRAVHMAMKRNRAARLQVQLAVATKKLHQLVTEHADLRAHYRTFPKEARLQRSDPSINALRRELRAKRRAVEQAETEVEAIRTQLEEINQSLET